MLMPLSITAKNSYTPHQLCIWEGNRPIPLLVLE